MGDSAIAVVTGLVATVTGFQLYREANDFYFSEDCRRCDGAGKLTCLKCKGYGFLKKGAENNIKAFKATNQEDVSTIYLCPFCKGQGTSNCFDCRGKAKLWPQRLNLTRMFKLRHVHNGAEERATWQELTAEKAKEKEIKRKVEGGFGGFKISGNANYLPYTDEELAQQQAEQAAKKG